MGITSFDLELIKKALKIKPDIKSVIELGAQSLYLSASNKPPFASNLYKSLGIQYTSIDLAGDNGAIQKDLAHPLEGMEKYDLVTNFGSSEHVVQMAGYKTTSFHNGHINSIYPTKVTDAIAGLYNCHLNMHNLLSVGGIMINVNPKTGNWPGHGYHWYTTKFYFQLIEKSEYELLEIGENAACGNSISGWNIYCVLKKTSEKFPSFEEFKTFSIHKS